MEDPPLTIRDHKYFRLIFEDVMNHPKKDDLTALHGTIIVRGGSVLSKGLNDPGRNMFSDFYKTHENYTIHSELAAIKKIRSKIDLSGCVAYNLRLDKHGRVRIAKPCSGCQRLLADYGLKKCFYTTDGASVECWRPRNIQEVYAAAI